MRLGGSHRTFLLEQRAIQLTAMETILGEQPCHVRCVPGGRLQTSGVNVSSLQLQLASVRVERAFTFQSQPSDRHL